MAVQVDVWCVIYIFMLIRTCDTYSGMFGIWYRYCGLVIWVTQYFVYIEICCPNIYFLWYSVLHFSFCCLLSEPFSSVSHDRWTDNTYKNVQFFGWSCELRIISCYHFYNTCSKCILTGIRYWSEKKHQTVHLSPTLYQGDITFSPKRQIYLRNIILIETYTVYWLLYGWSDHAFPHLNCIVL